MESRMDRMEKLMINLIEKIDQSKGKAGNVWFRNPNGLIIRNESSRIIQRTGYNDVIDIQQQDGQIPRYDWLTNQMGAKRLNFGVDCETIKITKLLRCIFPVMVPSIFGFLFNREPLPVSIEPLPVYFQFSIGKTSHKLTQLLKITCQLANKFISNLPKLST